jgi:hypothetical protein
VFHRAVIALLGLVGLLALATPATAAAATPVAVVIDYGSGATVANMPISSSATVRLSLSAPPAGTTTLTIDTAPGQEGALFAPTRHVLVFTPDTWNVAQQVRVISVSGHGAADLPVTGSDGETAVIHAYANWGPISSNQNRECHAQVATYGWSGGFVTTITISNTGTVPMTDWTLIAPLTADQQVTSSWGASNVRYPGMVVLTPLDWNHALAPGASISLGIQGTATSTPTTPTYAICAPEPYFI